MMKIEQAATLNDTGAQGPDMVSEMVGDTYVNLLMALEGAQVIGDVMLVYLLKMSLEQLYSTGAVSPALTDAS